MNNTAILHSHLPPFVISEWVLQIIEVLRPETAQDLTELRILSRLLNEYLDNVDPSNFPDSPRIAIPTAPTYLEHIMMMYKLLRDDEDWD